MPSLPSIKSIFATLGALCLFALSLAQTPTFNVQKDSTGALTANVATGTKTVTVSSGGTLSLAAGGAFNFSAGTLTGTLGPTNGGTGLAAYTLGDFLYASAANTLSALPGNTTATKKYLSQTGTGTVSAAPAWAQVAAADISGLAASATTDTTNAANITSGTLPNARIVSLPNANLANSAITIAGTSTSLGGSITQDTITGLASTGLLARTAANTLAARTLTGTSAEITVTNGDGVAGAPTLSLPTALTFTGKTVTGGTFSSGAFNGTVGATTPSTGAFTTVTAGTGTSTIGGAGRTTLKLLGGSSADQSPILSLFRAANREYFIAGDIANQSGLMLGNTGGLADYNDATLRAAANFYITESAVKIAYTGDATNTTSGSFQTAGGLGVVKKAYFGDKVAITNRLLVGATTNAVDTAWTGSGYEGSIMFPDSSQFTVYSEPGTLYRGGGILCNIARTGGAWSFVDNTKSGWRVYVGNGSLTDYFSVARTAPTTYSEVDLLKVSNAGNITVSGTGTNTFSGTLTVNGTAPNYFAGNLDVRGASASAAAYSVSLRNATTDGYSTVEWFNTGTSGKAWALGVAGNTAAVAPNSLYFYNITNGLLAAELTTGTLANTSLKLYGTVASSSTSTGALVVSGGLGVAGKIYAGNDINTAGLLNVTGSGDSAFGGTVGNNSITVSRSGPNASSLVLKAYTDQPTISWTNSAGYYLAFAGGGAEVGRWFTTSGSFLVGLTGDSYGSKAIGAAGRIVTTDTTDSASTVTGSVATSGGLGVAKTIYAGTSILSVGPTSGIGYSTGAGGTVTQATSRTTSVTLNKVSGSITLVSAAGSTSWQTFTVTDSAVAATDVIIVNQKSGTDLYEIHVTAVAAGSFNVSFKTTGGTTTEQPVFNFAVIKAVTS